MKILLVEDNKDIAEIIFDHFEASGCVLDYAANGNQGLFLANSGSYDCIILDIMLPGIDGITLCQQLRDEGNNTPIIMLTARDTGTDMLAGFKHGADDYVVKPFDLDILQARIHAVTRRSGGLAFQKHYQCGPLRIDVQAHQVFREQTLLKLNPTCYEILLLLAKKHPQPVSREEIERTLWQDEPPQQDILRKHIYQLRKIVDAPHNRSIIKTLPKVGYAIEYST